MTHAHVTFNIQGRRTSEPESFHVGKHLGLKYPRFGPRAPKSGDQFIVDRTPRKISLQWFSIQYKKNTGKITRIRLSVEFFWGCRYGRSSRLLLCQIHLKNYVLCKYTRSLVILKLLLR